MTREQQREALHRSQTFSEWMGDFLARTHPKTIVEIGPDVQLRLAWKFSPYCETYYAVALPEDTKAMEGWYEMGIGLGNENVKLISGNAIRLSELIPQANLIILHNVLLDLTGKDTELMWKYKRGELKCSNEEWAELVSRFAKAQEEGYKEFLKVAKPGFIITFRRADPDGTFKNFLVKTIKIDPSKIEQKGLLYDDSEELWEAHIIDNKD